MYKRQKRLGPVVTMRSRSLGRRVSECWLQLPEIQSTIIHYGRTPLGSAVTSNPDAFESSHSMSSSTRARIDCGTVRPSSFALEVGYRSIWSAARPEGRRALRPPENLVDGGGAPPKLVRARPVRHQDAGIDKPPPNVDRWQAIGGYKLDNPRLGQG